MDEKNVMENLLLLEKGVCDLYLHGVIESPTASVNQTFKNALKESLCMQNTIYDKMQAKGWYLTEQAEQARINTVRQKFNIQ